MPKLMVDFITSLDGYGAAEGWPGFWGMEGPEYLGRLAEEEEHTIPMGATTYRLMAGNGRDGRRVRKPAEVAAFDELNATPKVVFSSTLGAPLSWANTELVAGDAAEAVRAMKRDGTRPMHTVGSVSPCRSLLEAGLVGRFRVGVWPVINGATGQDRVYDAYPDVALDLVEPYVRRPHPDAGVRSHRARRTARRRRVRPSVVASRRTAARTGRRYSGAWRTARIRRDCRPPGCANWSTLPWTTPSKVCRWA